MRTAKSAIPPQRLSVVASLVLLGMAPLCLASPAAAQNRNNNAGSYNSGYSASNANLNRGVNVNTRDENNNQVFVNGQMQAPAGSVFSSSQGYSQSGGVGRGGGLATAIGNNLNVVVQGSWNRVVVDSTQVNNGDVSAQTNLNGSLDLR